MADPSKSNTQRLEAKRNIERILYFPKVDENSPSNNITFKEIVQNGKIVDVQLSLPSLGQWDIGKGESINSKVSKLLLYLQSEELNLRFQVLPSQMTNPAEVDRILDSGILTTDLLQLQNVNASFEIYLADTEEGGPLKNGGDNVSTGHSGVRGVNTSLSSSTVTIGKQKYSIREDGKVTDAKGKAVTDKNQVSQIMLKKQYYK